MYHTAEVRTVGSTNRFSSLEKHSPARKRREILIDSLGVSLYDTALALVLLDPKYLEERTEQGKDSLGSHFERVPSMVVVLVQNIMVADACGGRKCPHMT